MGSSDELTNSGPPERRKGLGYKYEHQTRRLTGFVVFMEKHKATTVTTKLVMNGRHCRPIVMRPERYV